MLEPMSEPMPEPASARPVSRMPHIFAELGAEPGSVEIAATSGAKLVDTRSTNG
jgi:hypothetical protein